MRRNASQLSTSPRDRDRDRGGLHRNASQLSARDDSSRLQIEVRSLFLPSIQATVTSRSLAADPAVLALEAQLAAEEGVHRDEGASAGSSARRDQLPAFFRGTRELELDGLSEVQRRRRFLAEGAAAGEVTPQFLEDTIRAFEQPYAQRTEADVDQTIAFTQHVHLLHSLRLSDIAREGLCRELQMTRFAAGAHIVREGDPSTFACIMIRGDAEVQKAGLVGVLAEIGPCDVFGELALLRNVKSRSASVVARSECCVLQLSLNHYDYYLRQWHRKTVQMRMDFLHSVPQLRAFTAHNLLILSQMLRSKHFRQGDRLVSQGERFDCLYIVAEGMADVTREVAVRVRPGSTLTESRAAAAAPLPPPSAADSPGKARGTRIRVEKIGCCCPRDVLGEEALLSSSSAPLPPQEVTVECTSAELTVLWLTKADFPFLLSAGYDVDSFIAHS